MRRSPDGADGCRGSRRGRLRRTGALPDDRLRGPGRALAACGGANATRGAGACPAGAPCRGGCFRDALDDRDQDVAHEVGGAVEGGGCSGATPPEIAERISVSALMLFIR